MNTRVKNIDLLNCRRIVAQQKCFGTHTGTWSRKTFLQQIVPLRFESLYTTFSWKTLLQQICSWSLLLYTWVVWYEGEKPRNTSFAAQHFLRVKSLVHTCTKELFSEDMFQQQAFVCTGLWRHRFVVSGSNEIRIWSSRIVVLSRSLFLC